MRRRDFLKLAGVPALAACETFPWPAPEVSIIRPGMVAGHRLREAAALATSAQTRSCDVVIIGSGVAGLTAGWRLAQQGYKNFLMLAGPEALGNAAFTQFGGLACPRGAHYLPLPTVESAHVREMLADLGVLEGNPGGEAPSYDETALVHVPEERLLQDGIWQEGVVPATGLGAEERAQISRFLKTMTDFRAARGRDGKRAFAIPLVHSSTDESFRQLDRLSFAAWLAQQGFSAPALLWYANYCCRDDYGASIEHVSAWAGVHYFASRGGRAANADEGAVLTWPGGLGYLANRLRERIGAARALPAMAMRLRETSAAVEIDTIDTVSGTPLRIVAKRAIVAMPLHVARHVVQGLKGYGFDTSRDLPTNSSWMVSNFLLDGFPPENASAAATPLAWDNVVYGGKGLGWVVATHQLIRQARPEQTVFTAYRAFSDQSPQQARVWMETAKQQELLTLAASDLVDAYGSRLWRHTQHVEICLRGHAMARPEPGFLQRPGIQALRDLAGRVLFAHADLSGLSIFEEAAWWGEIAARKVLSA